MPTPTYQKDHNISLEIEEKLGWEEGSSYILFHWKPLNDTHGIEGAIYRTIFIVFWTSNWICGRLNLSNGTTYLPQIRHNKSRGYC